MLGPYSQSIDVHPHSASLLGVAALFLCISLTGMGGEKMKEKKTEGKEKAKE